VPNGTFGTGQLSTRVARVPTSVLVQHSSNTEQKQARHFTCKRSRSSRSQSVAAAGLGGTASSVTASPARTMRPASRLWLRPRVWPEPGATPQHAASSACGVATGVPCQNTSTVSTRAGPTPALITRSRISGWPSSPRLSVEYCRNGQELAATSRALASAMRSIVWPCRTAIASDTIETSIAESASVRSTERCASRWRCACNSVSGTTAPAPSGSRQPADVRECRRRRQRLAPPCACLRD